MYAVLDGKLTEQEKGSMLNMQLSNSLLQQCSPVYWQRLRTLSRSDLGDLMHTGGVALPSSVDKTVAVRSDGCACIGACTQLIHLGHESNREGEFGSRRLP
jgi:hypothetical protein